MTQIVGNTSDLNPNASIGKANLSDPNIQSIAKNIFSSEADKKFATYELSELKMLPKSLFYDAATADGAFTGLFAYYVLGSGGIPYHKSDSRDYINKITPIESRNPTAKTIIDVTSGGNGVTPNYLDPESVYRGQLYNVKDFIFCKHYGVIPNNRMITLRRFPHPTLDSLRTLPNNPRAFVYDEKEKNKASIQSTSVSLLGRLRDKEGVENSSLPVAQAITYFGEGTGNSLASILDISTGLNFETQNQGVLAPEKTGDPGLLNSPFGNLIKSYVESGNTNIDLEGIDNLVGTVVNPEKNLNKLRRILLDSATTGDGPLSKKIFVNVNTVNQMLTRAQGFQGGFQEFQVTFEYNLTSVGEINTKLMFLDLMTNLLSLGADYGQFLSPELRVEQTNVGIGFPGGAEGYAQSIVDPLGYIKTIISKMLSKETVNRIYEAEKTAAEETKQMISEISNYIKDPDQNTINPNSRLFKAVSVMLSDAFLKNVYYQPIMLSGYPTGDWHMVVGNPLNPIVMMGNLVCKNVKINFNDELGPDDFPTEIKAVFTLQPGRQRHRGDWESMFNRGNGRLYLGQLAESGESTQAWINQNGVRVNEGNNVDLANTVQTNIAPDNTNNGR